MTPTAIRIEETDLKQAESITSGSASVAAVGQQAANPKLPEGNQEKDSTETSATECTSKEELKHLLLPAASPSCASDGVLDLCDESAGLSENLHVQDQLPVSEVLFHHATGEKQPDSE